MKSQNLGVLLVLVVVLAITKGDDELYTAKVSETEVIDGEGVCHKSVFVHGNGVEDNIPVRCDMAEYIVAKDNLLAVGDKMYSDTPNKLMVLTPAGCERRTYSDRKLESTVQLEDDDCEDVKLLMMKAFIGDDLIDSSDSSDSSSDDSEQRKAYDELRQWLDDNWNSESSDEEAETAKGDKSQSDLW